MELAGVISPSLEGGGGGDEADGASAGGEGDGDGAEPVLLLWFPKTTM